MGKTYTRAVFIWNVAILECELDFVLILSWQLVIAIDHVSVASTCLDQVLDLLGSNASPVVVSTFSLV
jgi:hypothetical protein